MVYNPAPMTTLRRQVRKLVPASLRPHLGALRRKIIAHPLRIESQWRQLLASPALDARQAELLRAVSKKIHPDDGMFAGDSADYFTVGLSALDCIDDVLRHASQTDVRDVLDLPSGYGRELRFFVRRFPGATFTACDIQPGAVEFCAQAFGAIPVASKPDLDDVVFERRFDLVWCGSLVTHLDADATRSLFKLFARNLRVGGVMIFTTHGDYVADRLVDEIAFYEVSREDAEAMTASYRAKGHAYQDYPRGLGYFDFHPDERGYGISLTSPAWVRQQAQEIGGLREVYFKPRGWANHQDVFAFQKQD
jgi:SAM-dependent methyltransferase